jgi:ABC-type polysaccharide/polyol phosphate transport system ATPase subunit
MGVADRDFHDKAQKRLKKYIARNECFLFASHNEELLAQMTDRQITISRGQIIEETRTSIQNGPNEKGQSGEARTRRLRPV